MEVRPIAGPLSVDVLIHPPDRRRRDIDNVLKALLDALQHGGAYEDDNQIVDLSIHKRCPIKGGKSNRPNRGNRWSPLPTIVAPQKGCA